MQIEVDGTKIERLVNGVVVTYLPDGIIIAKYKDGHTVQRNVDGSKIESFSDGRVEQTVVVADMSPNVTRMVNIDDTSETWNTWRFD